MWPEGLAIYVEPFDVRLPDEFVSHMVAKSFSIDLDAADVRRRLQAEGGDIQFWEAWCKKRKQAKVFHKIILNPLLTFHILARISRGFIAKTIKNLRK